MDRKVRFSQGYPALPNCPLTLPMSFWRKQVIEPALDSNLDKEIRALHSHLARDPSSAKSWFGLGNLCHVRGDKKEAMTCFLRSIEIDPGFAGAHVALGRLYAVEGKVDLAWEYARQAERLGDGSLCEQLSRYTQPPCRKARSVV